MRTLLLGLICIVLFCPAARPEGLPPNISIEVEIRGSERSAGEAFSSSASSSTKERIVVTDGLSASIRVGQDVPFVSYYRDYLFNNGYIKTGEIVFKEVGTSLKVTPTIRGDVIEIELTPEISAVIDNKHRIIDVERLSTTVMVADGQSISIGGFVQDKEFSGTFFKSGRSSRRNIILTPRILK